MDETSSKVSLKILIDRKGERVLFAEAGKDFVDFLFQILSLPLGSVVSLLSKENVLGSLGKLYGSIENLSDTYMQPRADKNNVLNPKTLSYASTTSNAPLLLPNNSASSTATGLYRCTNANYYNDCGNYVSDDPKAICPGCQSNLTRQLTYVSATGGNEATDTGEGGYVKGVITYMITDDLEVKPMSAISSISLLSKFNIKDLGTLEEKVVYLSMDEGLKLLKASLQSKTVFTDVFLGNKLIIEQS